jgi:hypothetical protein
MIDISFEIGGRKVSASQFGNALEQAVLQQVTENIKNSLSSVRCKEHGQRPKIKVKGQKIDNLTFEVEGCCQVLIDEALRKLK